MNKSACLAILALCAIALAACAQAAPPAVNLPINPGEKIGDFFITTGNESTASLSKLGCQCEQDKQDMTYDFPTGTQVNVSRSVMRDFNMKKTLDQRWSEHTYEMVIQGRRVNLQAFGPVDVVHPWVSIGVMRQWNVVIGTDKPGKITIEHSGIIAGEPFRQSSTLTFTASK